MRSDGTGHGHRRQPPPGTVKIYYRVQLKPGLSFQTSSPSYTLKLERNNYLKNIKWDRSKRLLNGSLLLLTQDDFSTIFFATVCRRDIRDLTTSGTFCIVWEGSKPQFQAEAYFTMLECDIFFETYRYVQDKYSGATCDLLSCSGLECFFSRHTLHALTLLNTGNFPMEKYIVEASSEETSPPYLRAIENTLDFKILMPTAKDPNVKNAEDYGLANLLDLSSWPSALELGMDESQYGAFQAAMTREFSIIQGPPGTGKTYIGIQIAKFLLANKEYFFPHVALNEDGKKTLVGSPVLVVCYTNHALDQFLEAIRIVIQELGMKPENELMRVGGQTKSEAMKDLLMFKRLEEAVKRQTLPKQFLEMYNESNRELRRIKHRRYTLVDTVRSFTNSDGIVDLYELRESLVGQRYLPHHDMDESILRVLKAIHTCKSIWKHFGLENRMYSLPGFRVPGRVAAIFKCPVQEEPVITQSSQSGGEEEAADDENYDLTELMANRIEELEYEVSAINGKRSPIDFKIGPSSFEQMLTQNRTEIENSRRLLNQPDQPLYVYRQLEDAIFYAESQIIRYDNIRSLLRQILKSHKEGLFQLPPVTENMLKETTNRFENGGSTMNEHYRENWIVYFHCLDKLKAIVMTEILNLEESLLKQNKVFKDLENYGYSQLLKRVKFVGATTTGAAKYNTILRMIKSKMGASSASVITFCFSVRTQLTTYIVLHVTIDFYLGLYRVMFRSYC